MTHVISIQLREHSAGEKYIFFICSALSVFLLIQMCQSYFLGALGRLTASLESLSICGVMQGFP